jgi:hypothetical protein
MSVFFANTRPGNSVSHGDYSYELPILYFRDDLFLLFFSADYRRVREAMPSDHLHPVVLPGGRAIVGLAAFNYVETSIGPYGEVAVVVPAVHGSKGPPVLIPALWESGYPGFGLVVLHLPVTGTIPRNGGRGIWGYPKFVADMHFTITPEYYECRLAEEEEHIFTMRAARKGWFRKDRKPLVTYTVKDGRLIKTTVAQQGSYRMSFGFAGSFVLFGRHPVAESIRQLGLGPRPLLARYYVERSAILPVGEVIEENVRPLEGYPGREREGRHRVEYLGP